MEQHAFSDTELLVIQNGLVLEIKRTATDGHINQLKHALALFSKLEVSVNAAVQRLTAAENVPKQHVPVVNHNA